MNWQPIETAPKDGTRVIIVDDQGRIDVAGFNAEWHERQEFVRKAKDGDVYRIVREDLGWWDSDYCIGATYWMPLPEPPKD